jgi:acyl-CoA synthetase (AMP-forming)/AMP-acid ligase II
MFTAYLDRGLVVNPDGICVTSADAQVTLTYREATLLSHRIAKSLRNAGIPDDARVAVYSPNNVIAFACVLGVLRAGMTWVALNPLAEVTEFATLLDHVECAFLMYHESRADRARNLLEAVSTIRGSIMFGDDCREEFERWLAPEGLTRSNVYRGPDAVAMIMGTGGTTGQPKAVPITNRQYLTMSLAFNAHMPEAAPPVYLVAPPMTHAAGLSALPVLAEGGTVVVHDGVVAGEIFDSIERHRVTRMFLPPTAIYGLLADPAVRNVDYSSLRHFIYAAAPMSVDKLIEALDVFGPVMTQTFGQAEAPMICTCMTPAEHVDAAAQNAKRERLGSCGRPSYVAEVALMDDDGQAVGPNERGEIVVRGDLVMKGYYRNAEATDEVRRPGGWHGTGDIGYRDESGFVYIIDRKRDLIISGGFNVYPSDVERVVWSHPAVLDCAVIGVPDEKWGEAVTAVVELKDGMQVEAAELIATCKKALGSVKAPKQVLFRELPRSNNGKVLKRVLRDEYWIGRQRMV